MTEPLALIRLMNWLSPVFPTGGFAYSGGLEHVVRDGSIHSEAELANWLEALVRHGSVRNDLILMAHAWRAQAEGLNAELLELSELAKALAGSAERDLEITAQGDAFAAALANWPFETRLSLPDRCPLSVAVGAAAAHGAVPLPTTLAGYLQNFLSNQLQAAIRLSVIGQNGAARIQAALETELPQLVANAVEATLDELGSNAILAEIAAMQHETLEGRLFRT